MADEKTASGETQRYTFRIPPESVSKLDELVEQLREESGIDTRTSALLYLIAKEHKARQKPRKRAE